MKKILEYTLVLAMVIAGIVGMSTAVFADDDVQELYSWNDVENFLQEGGNAILMENIDNDDHAQQFRQDRDAVIDMNGHDLYYGGDTCEVNANLVLINTSEKDSTFDLINYRGEDRAYPEVNGTLACKNVNMRFADLELRGTIIKYNSEYVVSGSEEFNGTLISFENTHSSITDEQFAEMAKSMELPTLKRKGYDFGSWTVGDKEITSLKDIKGRKTVKANWLSSLTVTFDVDGGTCDVETLKPNDEQKLTSIPVAEKNGMCFDGWFTSDGKKVTKDTKFEEDTTVKAKWATEESRSEDLAAVMKDMGFSQKKIDNVVKGLNGDSKVASMFSGGNIWIIAAIAALIILVIVILIIRNRRSRRRHRQFKMY